MITVEQLTKHFQLRQRVSGPLAGLRSLFSLKTRTIRAVEAITFSVQPGEIVGYLGPNGAGKSTTLKMLAGLLVPTSGHLEVQGYLPWRDRRRYVQHIGAVFGQRTTLWWDLPVRDSLEALRYIYRVSAAQFEHNIAAFSALLELDEFMDTPVRALSLGQRMRADLAAALLHNPSVLFLDEPTIGLDVVAKERIRQFIKHINREQGTTIMLTTHDLSDVEKLCERVLIIDHGRLLYDGGLTALSERFGGQRALQVDFSEPYDDPQVTGAELVAHTGLQATYRFDRQQQTASALINQLASQYRIRDLAVREPDIEETIRRIYEQRLLLDETSRTGVV